MYCRVISQHANLPQSRAHCLKWKILFETILTCLKLKVNVSRLHIGYLINVETILVIRRNPFHSLKGADLKLKYLWKKNGDCCNMFKYTAMRTIISKLNDFLQFIISYYKAKAFITNASIIFHTFIFPAIVVVFSVQDSKTGHNISVRLGPYYD